MTTLNRYPAEQLDEEQDDGTMPKNVEQLAAAVVGHRIIRAETGTWKTRSQYGYESEHNGLIITIDDGRKVALANTGDCCAYTELQTFLAHPERIDHVITGVGTTDAFTRWHIYADMGDVLEMQVGWSCGNPFFYAYGFEIDVIDDLKDVTVRTAEVER